MVSLAITIKSWDPTQVLDGWLLDWLVQTQQQAIVTRAQRGRHGVRYQQLGTHNACSIQLPGHLQQVGSGNSERSILILDSRDVRLQSPFQGWLIDEILTNANS